MLSNAIRTNRLGAAVQRDDIFGARDEFAAELVVCALSHRPTRGLGPNRFKEFWWD
jgi:hypothetical protein